jgi:hypothetical protein
VSEVQHGGATAGYRAFLTRFPDQGVAVALLCNRADANPGALAHAVADLFLDGQPDVAAVEDSAGGRTAAGPLDARLVAELEGHYRDTRTQGLVRVMARDGGLFAGGAPFEPIETETSPAKFRVGSYEVVVLPNPGARPALLRIDPDGDSIRAEPVEPFAPTPTELAVYEGRYHSPEAEVTYRVELRDDRLVMVDRHGDARVLTPLYPDGFARAGGIVRFTRGPGGRVLTIQWSAGRVWNLTFRRDG